MRNPSNDLHSIDRGRVAIETIVCHSTSRDVVVEWRAADGEPIDDFNLPTPVMWLHINRNGEELRRLRFTADELANHEEADVIARIRELIAAIELRHGASNRSQILT